VRSFQLKGTPVARGVVKRFDRVMITIWGSAFFPLTYINPSAPAPPDLLMTIQGFGEMLYFDIKRRDEPGHHVGTTSCSCRNNELYRLRGFPTRGRSNRDENHHQEQTTTSIILKGTFFSCFTSSFLYPHLEPHMVQGWGYIFFSAIWISFWLFLWVSG